MSARASSPLLTAPAMKPVIAITMGDYNGIGPEIVLRAVTLPAVRRLCEPVVVGSPEALGYYRKGRDTEIGLRPWDGGRTPSGTIGFLSTGRIRPVTPGRSTRDSGDHSLRAIRIAAALCMRGIAAGMVTAPVSKEAMAKAGSQFPGQTELLAELTGTPRVTMVLLAGTFRVGLATIHCPLKQVPQSLSRNLISEKISTIHASLRGDFGISSPSIAVLGLNPHAGEGGLLGREEIDTIIPAVRLARKRSIRVEGPFPADGFFGSRAFESYDAILAMYHDQGLIPLKLEGFARGVNFTAGLRIVRTSPDHGTAAAIAGKGIADPASLIEAIKLAVNILRNRDATRRIG